VVLLLTPFFLLGTGFEDLFHLFVMHFRLNLHIIGMLLLLLFELNPSFLDFFLTAFKLVIEFSQGFFIAFPCLLKLLLFLMAL
jgi:hypothetical protein